MSLAAINTWQSLSRDTVAPVITSGDVDAIAFLNTDVVISGLSATDNIHGDISHYIQYEDFYRGEIGTKQVEFTVYDSSGNKDSITIPVEIQGSYVLQDTPYVETFDGDVVPEFFTLLRGDFITENGGMKPTGNLPSSPRFNAVYFSDSNMHVQAVFNMNDSPSTGGIIFRWSDSSNLMYVNYDSAQSLRVIKRVNGVYTDILSVISVEPPQNDDFTVGIRANFDLIELIYNGAVVGSARETDNIYGTGAGVLFVSTENEVKDFRIARPDSDIDLLTDGIDFPLLSEGEIPKLTLSASATNAPAGQTITFTATATNADSVSFTSDDVTLSGTGNTRTAVMPSLSSENTVAVTATASNINGEVTASVIINVAEESLIVLKKNQFVIPIALITNKKTAEIESVLASLRTGVSSKVFVKPTDAVVLGDTFTAISFRLFQIGGSVPLFTKTLVDGITIEDGGILISLPKDDMTTTGDHYFDLTVTQSTPIVILDGRLKLLNGRS